MPTSAHRVRTDLSERVFSATTSLLLTKGLRRLRTADIAAAASTTESTLFRHYDSLDGMLRFTYERCWATINERIAQASFDSPRPMHAQEQLLADVDALWALRADDVMGPAATVAFLFLRRRGEILASPSESCAEQARFERRIGQLCKELCTENDRDGGDSGVLLQLILNYCATVWLTWFCMPTGSSDITTEHDLSSDEAQLGVMVLIDRFLRFGLSAADADESNIKR